MSKISELSDGGALQSTDYLIAVRSGGNVKVQPGSMTVDINGGTIDGVTIGGSSAGAGSFTTLTASGDVNFDSGTLFVDASANAVAVGTSSPYGGAILTVTDDTDNNFAIFALGEDATSEYIAMGVAGAGEARITAGGIGSTSNSLTFYTSSSGTEAEAMRLDASGNLLVGTTAAYGSDGTTIGAGEIVSKKTSFRSLTLDRLSTDGEIASFRKDGNAVGSIGAENNTFLVIDVPTNGSALIFEGSNDSGTTTRLAMSSDGGLEAFRPYNADSDALFDLGAGTRRFKDLYLSGGVYLGGTGAANLLDDYETGTWTPGVSFGGGTTGITYIAQQGKYRKVGNLVYIQAYIRLSSKGSSTGSAAVTGLPFTPSSVSNGAFSPLGDRGGLNTGGEGVSIYLEDSTTCSLYYSGFDGGGNNIVNNTQFSDTTEIDINICYPV